MIYTNGRIGEIDGESNRRFWVMMVMMFENVALVSGGYFREIERQRKGEDHIILSRKKAEREHAMETSGEKVYTAIRI